MKVPDKDRNALHFLCRIVNYKLMVTLLRESGETPVIHGEPAKRAIMDSFTCTFFSATASIRPMRRARLKNRW